MERSKLVGLPHPDGRARVNEVEAAALDALAAYLASTKSEAFRYAIRVAAEKHGLWPNQQPAGTNGHQELATNGQN